MGTILYLSDYRQEEPTVKLVHRTEPMAAVTDPIVRTPVFISSDTLFLSRKFLVQNIESFGSKVLLMPMMQDLDPFWGLDGVAEGGFNSPFAPCAAFFSVLRDYPKDLTAFVDGTIVAYQSDYDNILTNFNDLYVRARDHQGYGPNGDLSEDEFIRLGALFYLFAKCSKFSTTGLEFDMMGNVVTEWSGENRVVHLSYKQASICADRIRDCGFSSIPWKQFLARVRNNVVGPASWIFNLSEVDVFANNNPWDFSFQDFIELLDIIQMMSGHQMIVVLPKQPELVQWMEQMYTTSKRLHTETDRLGHCMAISNHPFVSE